MGNIVLLPYFAICTFVRLLSVVLYFTPTLGLFDTLHHLNQGGNSKAFFDSEVIKPLAHIINSA